MDEILNVLNDHIKYERFHVETLNEKNFKLEERIKFLEAELEKAASALEKATSELAHLRGLREVGI